MRTIFIKMNDKILFPLEEQMARNSILTLLQKIIIFASILFLSTTTFAQDDSTWYDTFPYEYSDVAGLVELGEIAELDLPDGYFFTGREGAMALMESYGNPISGEELGYIEPKNSQWLMLFEFENIGYVKDDEKDEIDADALFESFVAGSIESNKERVKNGWATLEITGWYQKPFYDTETNNLEWAIQGISSDSSLFLNYNVRLLGRAGVMRVTLVIDPELLNYELPVFKEMIRNFRYKLGNTYAEYQDGDKLYEYGLTALIGGGAAAVAAKTGAFKWLWKAILVGLAALGGMFKKIKNFFTGNKN